MKDEESSILIEKHENLDNRIDRVRKAIDRYQDYKNDMSFTLNSILDQTEITEKVASAANESSSNNIINSFL